MHNYPLKYILVKQEISKSKLNYIQWFSIIVVQILFALTFIYYFRYINNMWILFLTLAVLSYGTHRLYEVINHYLINRYEIGYIQFFPTEFHVFLENQLQQISYTEIDQIIYSGGMVDNYFSDHQEYITRKYLFLLKNGNFILVEAETEIRTSVLLELGIKTIHIQKVIKRILPPNGIKKSDRLIRKFSRRKSTK